MDELNYKQMNEDPQQGCGICVYKCESKEQLEEHIAKHHTYPCDQCQLCFQSLEVLENHKAMHHETNIQCVIYQCNVCGNRFGNDASLKDHFMSSHHIESTDCDQCNFKGTSVSELVSHILISHKGRVQ